MNVLLFIKGLQKKKPRHPPERTGWQRGKVVVGCIATLFFYCDTNPSKGDTFIIRTVLLYWSRRL